MPAGKTPNDVIRAACRTEADCRRITAALNADGAATIYADASGKATFLGVMPGTYYLMVSVVNRNRLRLWNQTVDLKTGASSLVLGSETRL